MTIEDPCVKTSNSSSSILWTSSTIKFSKKGDLAGSQFLEDVVKEGGWAFSGGCSFYIKNTVEFEIFNDKKV